MPEKTTSENLFERFCTLNNIVFDPISTQSEEGLRTPDYDILVSDQKIIVEVKQIEPNEEELEAIRQFEEGKMVSVGGEPGGRVRKKIKKASGRGQIRNRTQGIYPSILVLYNAMGIAGPNYTNSYNVLVGMYGLETLVLRVPQDYSPPTVCWNHTWT